jgi:peptidoglycan DL-endopeptidase CwlO
VPGRMRLRLLIAAVALPLVLWAVLPVGSAGQTGKAARLQSKIEKKRAQVQKTKRREQVLASDVAGWSHRINRISKDIGALQAKQVRIQADLDRKRAELERVQERLRQERVRLTRLRARLAEGRIALAQRLTELYKADEPDMVTVVLESDGFADLLERSEFLQRVSHQDARIIDRVKTAKADATRTAKRLDKHERKQTAVAAAIQQRRDEVAQIKGHLVDRRQTYASARGKKQEVLAQTREHRHDLEGDLKALEAASARVAAALRQPAAGGGGSISAGPPRAGAGGFIWPVNGPLTSPFGPRWGRLHAGVDISAPEGTPIRAAASGKVVLLGWTGGYGNYTCVAHGGAVSTCYAHQVRYGTSMGASVSQGQVIGYVGNTGNSFGAHLHFEVRINGTPVNPAGYL